MSKVVDEIKETLKKIQVYERVKVSPNIAKELLEMNTDNRKMTERLVKHYSNQMVKGIWKFTGDPVKISKTGRILDFQHRLAAVIQSDTIQEFNIQTGLEDDVFSVLDTGKNRTASDVLHIMGCKNPTILQGALKIIINYDRRKLGHTKGLEKFQRVTNNDIADWQEGRNVPLMEDCVAAGSRWYSKARLLVPMTYAGFCYLFSRKSKEQAFDFFDKLSSGEDISATKNSSIYVLRQKLINSSASTRRMPSEEKHAILIKAWNAFRDGTVVKRLSWTDDESFPRAK